jgi:integrase/recombinase XerD
MTCLFRSIVAPRLQSFLDIRRALGRNASSEVKILRYLDRFLMAELKQGQALTLHIAERWIDQFKHLSVGTRINRISILRQFCFYLSRFDKRTCLINRSSLPRRRRPAPHIYTKREVQAIINAAKRIGPSGSLRPAVISTLIGLLYSTGLRIGEALRLTLADVDLRHRLLVVRQTKFRKSRYVPLSEGTTRAMTAFIRKRRAAGFSTKSNAAVFVNPQGRAYGAPRICEVFLEIVRRIGLRGPAGQPGPKIHHFRHSFAVTRLATWYREGAILPAKMPLLTTYLGHTTVTCTEVYLQATAELLQEANEKFHRHCAVPTFKEVSANVH